MQPDVQLVTSVLSLLLEDLERSSSGIESTLEQVCTTTDEQILSVGQSVQQIFKESDAYNREFRELVLQLTEEDGNTFAAAIQQQSELARGMPAALESILLRSREVVTHVANAQVRIRQILKLVAGIEDIALSAKILTVNARIEATRAGEAGRGFAVVATNMQELSQSVATANASIHLLGSEIGSLLPLMSGAAVNAAQGCEDQTARVRGAVDIAESQYKDARHDVVATLDLNRQRGESFRRLSEQLLEQIQFGDLVIQKLRATAAEAKHPRDYVRALVSFLEANPNADATAIADFQNAQRSAWLGTTAADRQRAFAMNMLEGAEDAAAPDAEEGSVMLF